MKRAIKTVGVFLILFGLFSCKSKGVSNGENIDAAQAVYVPPGQLDKYYAFMSGGFSGQLNVYALPSGRLLKEIPVFSQFPQTGYGYGEGTKQMLNTSFGFVPWDDAHHPDPSQTNGQIDGRWIFINGNNTPRIARIDLKDFETKEILEIPNSAGNHSSSFVTENTEYVVAGTRFSVPIPQRDMPIKDYKGNFKGTISFIKVDPKDGTMSMAFQILMPGFDFDLAHPGRGKSNGWFFFSTYNTEEANSLFEVNSSKNDKDFIACINWKKAEEYVKQGKAKSMPANFYHNIYSDKTHQATSTQEKSVLILDPKDCPGMVYFVPAPKSPHGCDVDPTGNYIVANGKLSADLSVFSFDKIMKAIEAKKFEGDRYGIPVINYDAALAGIVKKPGLGPLHTEFDEKGNAYTTFFISSEIVKWDVKTQKIEDRHAVYYSPGHLAISGGNSSKPDGKYLLSLNKITKDRYLPVGPELNQSAQLFDISGDKMKLLLDFPTIGEPHYAQIINADKIKDKVTKIFKIEENKNPFVTKSPNDGKMVRNGNRVDIYLTMMRSHFTPDNFEGIKVGDDVYFHLTNLEQDYDMPHGFAVMGNNNAEILVLPGQTKTLYWKPTKEGVWPFYCTDFCSALHQEMQGYLRVSPKNSNTPLKWYLGDE